MISFAECGKDMASLCAPQAFEERTSPLHGRGLFSTAPIAKGALIFEEQPLVAMQTLANRFEVLACAKCLGPLPAPPEVHLHVLLGKTAPHEVAARPEAFGVSACARDCGELYCSEACRDAAWAGGHCHLCVGHVSEAEAADHPMVRFKVNAASSNEILLLAGAVVADMLVRYEADRSAGLGAGVSAPFDGGLPYGVFVRNLWWNVAQAPRGAEVSGRRRVLLQSAGAVRVLASLAPEAPTKDPYVPHVACSPEGRVFAMVLVQARTTHS